MSDHFTCPICQEVPDPSAAAQCVGCRTVFCEPCVTEWSTRSRDCANCRGPHGYEEADKAIQRVLGEISVECPYDCGANTTKSELLDHCRTCPKRDGRYEGSSTRSKSELLKRSDCQSASRVAASSSQQEQEQCEPGFGSSALLVAAVGGALVGVLGGVIGALVVSSNKKKRNE